MAELPPLPGYLTAFDASKQRNNKCVIKLKHIEELIIACQKKIKLAAQLGMSDILFEIPPMADKPYDVRDVSKSLKAHFERQVFYVKYADDQRTLYISWRYVSSKKK